MFDFTLEAESYVNECYFGLGSYLLTEFGVLDQEPTACEWRRYKPQLPLRQFTAFDNLDKTSDYIPWSCNDYAELDTYDDNSNASGFEDIGDWNGDDPDNVVVE